MTTALNQHFAIARGESRGGRFRLTGIAAHEISGLSWRVAARADQPLQHCDLVLTLGSGITLRSENALTIVEVRLSSSQSQALPRGRRHHELWVTDASGQPLKVAEGVLTVTESLWN